MKSYFLYIEIKDPDFIAFYDDFVHLISGERPIKPPHITIRGPYRNPIDSDELLKHRSTMHNSVLCIGPIGHFSNSSEEVLFLNVDSTQLRKTWWKPDYPIKKDGYNPHISLYRGNETDLVDAIINFEPLQKVSFLCFEYDIVSVVKEKKDVGNEPEELPILKRASDHRRFEGSDVLPINFFSRLERLVKFIRFRRKSTSAQLTLDFKK